MNEMENNHYWLERMIEARITGNDHQAIYHTDKETWNSIQKTQRIILKRIIKKKSSVIDVGCGCGYLLECIPEGVTYHGIDLNPHLIEWAKKKYEKYEKASFVVGDAKNMCQIRDGGFDWSVSRSLVGCSGLYGGYEVASQMYKEIVRVGKRSLFLGYDPADEFTFGDNPTHHLTLGDLKP